MLPSDIEQLLQNLSKAEDPNQVTRLMGEAPSHNPGFRKLGNLVLEYGPFRIERMLTLYAADLTQALETVAPLQLQSAPVLVKELLLPEQECVLVMQYPGTQGWPVPYDEMPPESVPELTRRRFLREMDQLAEAGWQHRYGARGTAHWLVNRDTGNIVLEAWQTLAPLDEAERPEFIRKIRTLSGMQP